MLYIISTPIGNLQDFSPRAVETLKKCDKALVEDTRVSSKLLFAFGIKIPLISFHKFNEKEKMEPLLEDMLLGKNIALMSDAGTPLISDPGELLVRTCQERGIKVAVIPGPSAPIAALSLSGLSPIPFQFVGFLPKSSGERERFLKKALDFEGTSIFFETSERLVSTLTLLKKTHPEREIVVARELTKIFEEVRRGSSELLEKHFLEKPPKGECVLLVGKAAEPPKEEANISDVEKLTQELIKECNLSKSDAIKVASKLTGTKKQALYKAMQ